MTKIQITNKSQIQIFNKRNVAGFEFRISKLEFVCYLGFEYWDFISQDGVDVVASEITNNKLQIPNKSQRQNFNDRNSCRFEFGIWGLKFVCYLWFEFWGFGCKDDMGN